MWDTIKELLGTFVLIAASIEYGSKTIKLLKGLYKELKNSRKRRRK